MRNRIGIPLILAAVALLGASCYGKSNTGTGTTNVTAGAGVNTSVNALVNTTTATGLVTESTVAVTIVDNAFSPTNLAVKRGTTVVWTNGGAAEHTVNSESGTELNSGADPLLPGGAYRHTFNATGSFPYVCLKHPGMAGLVTVSK